MSSSRPHRCDEFPAEYSLASCSPAELASASSASLMLQPTTPFVELISANGNQGTFLLSQSKGSPHGRWISRELKLHCLSHSPFGRSSWPAGNQCADSVREFGNSRGDPSCVNSVEKSCGKSVPGPNGVRNGCEKARGFHVFMTEQERAAFWPQRDAYGIKLKNTNAVATELLK